MTWSAIIFDFDGVIVESVDIKTKAFRELFSEYPEQAEKIVQFHLDNVGVSRFEKFKVIYRDFLKKPLSEDESKRLGERFSKLVYEEILQCPLVKGIEELLPQLVVKYPLYVVSAVPQDEVHSLLRARGLEKYFQRIYGMPPTLKADAIQKIIELHGCNPEEVLLIGDGLHDYQAAKATGIKFVGRLRDGNNPFTKVDCNVLVHDMTEFKVLLEEGKI